MSITLFNYHSRKIAFLFCICISAIGLFGCSKNYNETTQVTARPTVANIDIETGKHELNLGSTLFINRGFYWRDGYIYIPTTLNKRQPAPLLIWLHGGGGSSADADHILGAADKHGIVVLSLDARHNTWDGIDSPFGPDVRFIDKVLAYTFERVNVDINKIALGGLSDGGTYALSVGRVNGDLFTHLIAVAPWSQSPPSEPIGMPPIFLGHGINDTVYPLAHTKYFLLPRLKKLGYNVEYFEFNGPHWATAPAVNAMLDWFMSTPSERQ